MDLFDERLPGVLLEVVAAALTLVSVWLTVRQNVWCWPVGLIGVLLYAAVYFRERFYANAALQILYVFLQFYGWYNWLYGGKKRGAMVVVRLRPGAGICWVVTAGIATVALGRFMNHYTDANLPYWDAGILVFSLVAQWLMAWKVLASWLFWIAIDLVATGVFLVQGLYPTAVLYGVLLLLAVLGYLEWKKTLAPPKAA